MHKNSTQRSTLDLDQTCDSMPPSVQCKKGPCTHLSWTNAALCSLLLIVIRKRLQVSVRIQDSTCFIVDAQVQQEVVWNKPVIRKGLKYRDSTTK